jgi:hypothetical protein
MSGSWKTVRVFISSTFRDMHAERDHLVKVVFPRLRQWCEERRLHLVDIDLRWGVTKEEADNGKAIDLCLEEIDGSRPFFVCLLGGRYGWVPDKLPPEELYRFQGLQATTHCSITHLEVLHAIGRPIIRRLQPLKKGVLAPSPCPHAFFFFRRENCLPTPGSAFPDDAGAQGRYRDVFFEPPPRPGDLNRRQQLSDLKATIRGHVPARQIVEYQGSFDPSADNPEDNECPRGRLGDLDRFGRWVYALLCRAIRRQFAEHLATLGQRDPLADEQAYHDALIENRTQVHVPRTDVEQQLDDYVAGGDPRVLVLTGGPGSGKTAILAHWVEGRRNTDPADPSGEFLLARFVGASPSSVTITKLLANICVELQRRFDLQEEVSEEIETAPGQKEKRSHVQAMEVPADPNEVLGKWPKFLEAVSGKGRVVIVIDALNQLDSSTDPTRLYWFPRELPAGVRLIASVLDHGQRSRPDYQPASGEQPDWLAALRRLDRREVAVPELSDGDRRQIIRELPSVFCKSLDEDQLALLLKNPATRNPLFLTVALEELRIFGSFDKLPNRIAELPRAIDEHDGEAGEDEAGVERAIEALFGQVLDRLDQEAAARKSPGLVSTIFRLLASAKEGLSERELRELVARLLPGMPEQRRAGELQVVLRQVRSYLLRKAHPQGALVDFYHRSFWEAVRAKYLPAPSTHHIAHRDLAEYFDAQDYYLESIERQRERMKPPCRARPVNTRKVSELPWQRLQMVHDAREGNLAAELPSACDRLEQLFEDISFLESMTQAGQVFELATELTQCVNALPDNRPQRDILKLLDEALRREIHFIHRHREAYPQALFQCLWNHGWWYDCPQAAAHYRIGSEHGAPEYFPWKPLGPKLYRLLESWRDMIGSHRHGFCWVRSLRPPPDHLGSGRIPFVAHIGGEVFDVASSPDGNWIAVATTRNVISLRDAATGEERLSVVGNTARFTNDGRVLITICGCQKGMRILSAADGAEQLFIPLPSDPSGEAVFLPNDRHVVCCLDDGTVRVFDAHAGIQQMCMQAHEGGVQHFAVTPDGKYIATVGRDRVIRTWRVDFGTLVAEITDANWNPGPVIFSAESTTLVSAWSYSQMYWYQTPGRMGGRTTRGHRRFWRIALVDLNNGEIRARLVPSHTGLQAEEYDPVREPAPNLDGPANMNDILLLGSLPHSDWVLGVFTDNSIRVWDLVDGRHVYHHRREGVGQVRAAASYKNGRMLLIGSSDGSVEFWEVESAQHLLDLNRSTKKG